MAVISIGDTTVTVVGTPSGANITSVVTASTADNGDTVDVSSVASTIYSVSVLSDTDGLLTASVDSSGVVTLPGATANEARTIFILGK